MRVRPEEIERQRDREIHSCGLRYQHLIILLPSCGRSWMAIELNNGLSDTSFPPLSPFGVVHIPRVGDALGVMTASPCQHLQRNIDNSYVPGCRWGHMGLSAIIEGPESWAEQQSALSSSAHSGSRSQPNGRRQLPRVPPKLRHHSPCAPNQMGHHALDHHHPPMHATHLLQHPHSAPTPTNYFSSRPSHLPHLHLQPSSQTRRLYVCSSIRRGMSLFNSNKFTQTWT